ncbi:MAG: DUF4384 domain-containing protein [Pseudomonadales bacterium]
MRPLRAGLATLALALVVGCQAIAPALTSLMMAFGQDLLAATAVNYSPRYAVELENLLAVMARQATGLEFQSQLAQAGYQPPPPSYAQTQPPAGYGQYGDYQQGGYQQGGYPQGGYQEPYPGQPATQDPYGAPQAGYGQATYQDPYAVQQADYGVTGYQDPYALQAGGYRTRSADALPPVSLGVALLAQRAGSTQLEAISDGDTLRDGRGDPSRGDLLRVHLQANCACYVYVIGIDATGYVARIFPDPDEALTNPVQPGVNYLMPGGSQWWALDDHRGIEQIYFVAAREPRPDLEAAVAQLAGQPRQLSAAEYRPVREPAVVPVTRGLVKVEAPAPVAVPMSGTAPAVVTPTIFTSGDAANDVVITRWFHHE